MKIKIVTGLIIVVSMSLLSACYVKDNVDVPDKGPNLTAARYNAQLGLAYLQQGNAPQAKQKLLLALKQGPKWPEAYDSMAYYLEMTGSQKEAESYYKKAIDLSNGSGKSLNNYGTFLCRHAKYIQAEKYFLAAVEDQNYLDTAEAYENAGLCALAIPNYAQAESYFKQALQKDPRRTTSIIELAEVYYKLGKYHLSRVYLKDFLTKGSPDAKSLWLGIRLANKSGDMRTVKQEVDLLKTRFAKSNEYLQYKKQFKVMR